MTRSDVSVSMHIDFFKLNICSTDSKMHACFNFWKVCLHFFVHLYDLSFQVKLCNNALIYEKCLINFQL